MASQQERVDTSPTVFYEVKFGTLNRAAFEQEIELDIEWTAGAHRMGRPRGGRFQRGSLLRRAGFVSGGNGQAERKGGDSGWP